MTFQWYQHFGNSSAMIFPFSFPQTDCFPGNGISIGFSTNYSKVEDSQPQIPHGWVFLKQTIIVKSILKDDEHPGSATLIRTSSISPFCNFSRFGTESKTSFKQTCRLEQNSGSVGYQTKLKKLRIQLYFTWFKRK
jgi:hypothetical protein